MPQKSFTITDQANSWEAKRERKIELVPQLDNLRFADELDYQQINGMPYASIKGQVERKTSKLTPLPSHFRDYYARPGVATVAGDLARFRLYSKRIYLIPRDSLSLHEQIECGGLFEDTENGPVQRTPLSSSYMVAGGYDFIVPFRYDKFLLSAEIYIRNRLLCFRNIENPAIRAFLPLNSPLMSELHVPVFTSYKARKLNGRLLVFRCAGNHFGVICIDSVDTDGLPVTVRLFLLTGPEYGVLDQATDCPIWKQLHFDETAAFRFVEQGSPCNIESTQAATGLTKSVSFAAIHSREVLDKSLLDRSSQSSRTVIVDRPVKPVVKPPAVTGFTEANYIGEGNVTTVDIMSASQYFATYWPDATSITTEEVKAVGEAFTNPKEDGE